MINQATGRTAHASITIVLWHYLLTADGTPPADRWLTFRELPNGLFYSQAFAQHAENLLADKYGSDVAGFRRAADALGGQILTAAPGAGLAPRMPPTVSRLFPAWRLPCSSGKATKNFPVASRCCSTPPPVTIYPPRIFPALATGSRTN